MNSTVGLSDQELQKLSKGLAQKAAAFEDTCVCIEMIPDYEKRVGLYHALLWMTKVQLEDPSYISVVNTEVI